jgi:hypothetical protein
MNLHKVFKYKVNNIDIMSALSYSNIDPTFCKESFSRTTLNSGDLNLLYTYGKEIHKNYFMFEVSNGPFSFDMVLVDKVIYERTSTIQDLIETLIRKLGDDYKNVYYSKDYDDSRYFLEDHPNKEMDLAHFAFLNLNPSHSFYTDSDNKIYRLSINKNYTRPLGSIVLDPSRPQGESIGPFDQLYSNIKNVEYTTEPFPITEEGLRNENFQLRSDPPNPKMNVTPWNLSTITSDFNKSPTDIGDSAF